MWTEKKIANILTFVLRKHHVNIIVPNIFLFEGYESDIVAYTKSDYSIEYEIKCSRSDFKNDLKKSKHVLYDNLTRRIFDNSVIRAPNYFYYVCPPDMIGVDEIPRYAGLIYTFENNYVGFIKVVKRAIKLHREKAHRNEFRKIATSLSHRFIKVYHNA